MASDGESEPASKHQPSCYAPVGDKLSQGDIILGIPPAILDHPIVVCRPDGGKPGRGHFAPPDQITRPPAVFSNPEKIHATGRVPGYGIVIWEDCQIEKMENQGKDEHKWYVGVAPVFSLRQMIANADHRAPILEGRRMAFFPLPADQALGLNEDHYVDLRLIVPVRYTMVGERRAALTPEARAAFQAHLFKFLTAKTYSHAIECPACSAMITADKLLQDLHE
jgi:hypothetical protein